MHAYIPGQPNEEDGIPAVRAAKPHRCGRSSSASNDLRLAFVAEAAITAVVAHLARSSHSVSTPSSRPAKEVPVHTSSNVCRCRVGGTTLDTVTSRTGV
jgi:hypothetical protein